MNPDDLFRWPEKRWSQMTPAERRTEKQRIHLALAVLRERAAELRKRLERRPPIDRERLERDLGVGD